MCSASSLYTGFTTWPLVAIQPSGWMMKPVPFSVSGSGVTTYVAFFPQRIVTSARTSVRMPTTAGLTRRIMASARSTARSSTTRSPAAAGPGAARQRINAHVHQHL